MTTIRFFFLFIFIPFISDASILNPLVDSIPMRDGKKLPADIYLPAGWTSGPVILIQTPYNRIFYRLGLPLGIGLNLDSSQYAIVVTDWRGFYGGFQAAYSGSPTRGEDGYDAVEWIATQVWSNGNIGTWGPSALGKVQYQTARENPPHLKCICPLVAGPQYEYQEYFPNGCYRTEYVEQLDGLGYGMSPVLLTNPVYNFLWQIAENTNFYPDSIRVPALMIGGWYDHNTDLMIDFFNAIRSSSPANVQSKHRLLMGPWVHGGHSTANVGSGQQGELFYPNAVGWNDSLALMFFDYYLRSIANGWNSTPFIQYYTIGQNLWNTSAAWPPAGMTPVNLFFHTDTTMDAMIPSTSSGSLSFQYNPQDPSPTVGGPTLRLDLDQGPYNQADSVESRNDILKFTTAPLAQDVLVNGAVKVHLEVSSDQFDTDFCIRLCDVYPTGESMLVNDGVYRMRFRDGFTAADTSLMVPGQHYFVDINLPNTSIVFLAGHRIRLDVTSSNYPRFNRNMNTGGPMYPAPIATAGDTLVNPQIATNTVYTNSNYSSYATFPVNAWPSAIAEMNEHSWWSVYPNPAAEFIEIKTSGAMNQFTLFDATGNMVMTTQTAAATTMLDIRSLSSGLYILQVMNETGTSFRKVLISR
ncbi:MAG: CocE/NonD family hydrolase [Bacteroidia bacterium]